MQLAILTAALAEMKKAIFSAYDSDTEHEHSALRSDLNESEMIVLTGENLAEPPCSFLSLNLSCMYLFEQLNQTKLLNHLNTATGRLSVQAWQFEILSVYTLKV